MINIDLKSLLRRLNSQCTRSLEAAAGLCISRTHYEVSIEHVILKLLDEANGDIRLILAHFEIDAGRLEREIAGAMESFSTGSASKPVFSPLLIEWFQDAWMMASVNLGQDRIRSGALLLTTLDRSVRYGTGRYLDLLGRINKETLISEFSTIVAESVEQPSEQARTGPSQEAAPMGDGTALGRFCIDFTERARSGEIDPVFGRDGEIRRMIDILARRRKNNPIVVGEAGVGKTAVVEGLALRVVEGDVPELLADVSILGLDMGLLQAGAGMKGEFENRLKQVITEVNASPKPIILFIDEAHVIIGAGGQAGGSDAANLLKPALARGELRTIAATTWSEYKKYFEKDAALARRFQLVKLDEPTEEVAVMILRGLKPKYEESHDVIIRDDAIVSAAQLSNRYLSGRQLPDKAVDLLDTSAARVKIQLTSKPDVIEDRERETQAYRRERDAIVRDRDNGLAIDEDRLNEIDDHLVRLTDELATLTEKWEREKDLAARIIELRKGNNTDGDRISVDDGERTPPVSADGASMQSLIQEIEAVQGNDPLVRIEVDPDIVAKVVSDWTDIPLGKLMRDEAQSILKLEDNLKSRVKGQDGGLEAISQVIRSAKAGLKDPIQPLGVFLLAGPSGVGKTETGLAIADLVFGGERFMVSVNMSEFQEKHTVSRLIGSPPGYVGYGQGGILTEAVRQRPYSVVLLDEVEKANLEVMNLFYQVFDKGVLSDGEGRVIDFRNTIIILTSNLASDVITEMCAETPPPVETLATAVRPILSNHFKPALLARMTIVPYMTLPADVIKDIVGLKLDRLAERMVKTQKVALRYSDEVVDRIAERCQEVETGARNIDHIMNGSILPMMSGEILVRMGEGELPPEMSLKVSESGEFTLAFGG